MEQAVESVGLTDFLDRYPWELSGGMQQRVAIARALAYQPEILLMDEPFASVDAQTRADLEDLVLQVREQYGVTIVFVTHDIDESVYLGDRIVVLTPSPTEVQEQLDVDLPRPRDQIDTKELPEFAQLRGHVYRSIKRKGAAEGGGAGMSRAARPSVPGPGDQPVPAGPPGRPGPGHRHAAGGAAHHQQGRAGGRPGAQPAVRQQPDLPAGALHPRAPDLRHHRAAAARPGHLRRLGLVGRLPGPQLPRRGHGRVRPRRAGVLVRPARALLGGARGPGAGRRPGHPDGRHDLRPAPADHRPDGGHRPAVHAHLRAAADGGGGRGAPGGRARVDPAGGVHRRAGRVAARRAHPDRGGLRRPLRGPRRPDRGGQLRLPVHRGRRPAGGRERVHLRDPRPRPAAGRARASAGSWCSPPCAASASR